MTRRNRRNRWRVVRAAQRCVVARQHKSKRVGESCGASRGVGSRHGTSRSVYNDERWDDRNDEHPFRASSEDLLCDQPDDRLTVPIIHSAPCHAQCGWPKHRADDRPVVTGMSACPARGHTSPLSTSGRAFTARSRDGDVVADVAIEHLEGPLVKGDKRVRPGTQACGDPAALLRPNNVVDRKELQRLRHQAHLGRNSPVPRCLGCTSI